MKVRSGFVSNSSSSSFIVPVMTKVDSHCYSSLKSFFTEIRKKYYSITLPVSGGQHSFDWEEEVYSNFEDKLNYLFLQIMGLTDNPQLLEELKSKLEEALKSICAKVYGLSDLRFTFDMEIDYNAIKWDSIYDFNDVYMIDHQSTWNENADTVEMFFKSNPPKADLIETFLLGDSYIQGGNDNDYMSDSYFHSKSILNTYIKGSSESNSSPEEKG